jgi:hypothetical protein
MGETIMKYITFVDWIINNYAVKILDLTGIIG